MTDPDLPYKNCNKLLTRIKNHPLVHLFVLSNSALYVYIKTHMVLFPSFAQDRLNHAVLLGLVLRNKLSLRR